MDDDDDDDDDDEKEDPSDYLPRIQHVWSVRTTVRLSARLSVIA